MPKEKKSSIDSLYEQTMLIAKQVKELKKEVMGEQTYSFTQEQLKEFSERLYDNFTEYNNSQISEIEFSNDFIELELVDSMIVTSINSASISNEIENIVEPPTDKEMSNIISEILDGMEIELQ
jgi:flagellar motor protein MotB